MSKKMVYRVDLTSDLYGLDTYEYDTLDEAIEGIKRLWVSCNEEYLVDGEMRWISLVVGDEDDEEDEDEWEDDEDDLDDGSMVAGPPDEDD